MNVGDANDSGSGSAGPGLPGPGLGALHVFGLYMLAFVQPLFGVLAESPTFFVAHHARAPEVLTVTGVLCLGLPLPALAVLFLVRRFAPAPGGALLLGCVALFAGLLVLTGVDQMAALPWLLPVVAAAVAGLVAALGYWRFALIRSFATACSMAVIVVPVAFLGFSPVRGLLLSQGSPQALAQIDSSVPIVYVIFDELPLVSLLEPDLSIDEVRFPNFAALASRSTWYRNATTVDVSTQNALPAMLTGRRPRPEDGRSVLPRAEDLPENLFTLVAGSYDLHVFEALTALCPEAIRGCRREEAFSRRVRSIARDLAIVQAHVLLPAALTRDLPSVTSNWRDFAGSEPVGEPGTPDPTALELAAEFAADHWKEHAKTGRRHQYQLFLESLRPSARALFFAHSVLPHEPFEHLPSGQRYSQIGSSLGLDDRAVGWLSDEAAIQAQQRHLLQLAFVDTLVGDLLARLEEVGLYDDALLIVGSDHGASFRGGGWIRELNDENQADVLSVPLIIKYPGQRMGRVDDRNAEIIDILPTIADVLAMDLPWKTDGRSLLGPPDPDRSEKQTIRLDFHRHVFETLTFALTPESLREAVALKARRFGSGLPPSALFGIGRFRSLLGARIDDLQVEPASRFEVTLEPPGALENVDPSGVLPLVQGRVEPRPRRGEIAVAVNGTIRNVTRTRLDGGFAAPMPAEAFQAGANTAEILALSGSPESPVLLRARTKP